MGSIVRCALVTQTLVYSLIVVKHLLARIASRQNIA